MKSLAALGLLFFTVAHTATAAEDSPAPPAPSPLPALPAKPNDPGINPPITPPGVYKSEPHTSIVVVPKPTDKPAIKEAPADTNKPGVLTPDLKLTPRNKTSGEPNATSNKAPKDGAK